MDGCGIIYSATGRRYVDEATASARSSLRFNRVPHLIFCDEAPNEAVDGIEFVQRARLADPFRGKILDIGRLPFARTLFLDSDTYVAGGLEEIFELMSRFDFAAAHAPVYTKAPDPEGSAAFYDFNSGVIAVRRCNEVARMLESWAYIQERWAARPPFPQHTRDQHPLRRALWQSQVSLYVMGPEYNYRTPYPGRLVGPAKVLHGRCRDPEAVIATLNADKGPRTFGPFPIDG